MVAVGYSTWNATTTNGMDLAVLAERLTVVFLVALPIGFLADHLAEEISAHRLARDEAEHRTRLLRAAALGGQRSTKLDVDEIIAVLRETVASMGFSEPEVFELCGTDLPDLTARPVPESRGLVARVRRRQPHAVAHGRRE
jgi:hypothetical protein